MLNSSVRIWDVAKHDKLCQPRLRHACQAHFDKITAVIEHIEDRDIEDYLLERSPRFRKMLNKVRGESDSLSLAEYRKSRGI